MPCKQAIIYSLKNQKQFDQVSKHSTKLYGSCFTVYVSKNCTFLDNYNPKATFFGMKVSKKLSKKAVIRNKVKRRIRHIIRLVAKNPKTNITNHAFIIIPRQSFLTMNFARIHSDFHKIYKKFKKELENNPI